jgi:putative tRNA adenosine deaminase-associated protein
VAYTATALARTDDGWTARDVDLAEVEDLDAAVDLMRDLVDGALVLLMVEEDDEYVGIVRVRGDDDPRVFISDVRSVESSPLATRLFGDALPFVEATEVDDDEEDAPRPEADPGGDPALLADLGTSAPALLELCAEEGMLPADVIYALCEKAGCVDVLEEVRGGV